MTNNFTFGVAYNPDVLTCLANLSSDEVFTPPSIANKMLDMLPQEIFCDPSATFLDPACKSGVFLREIAKRLIKGLERKIPNLQERLDHIFQKQLYGIAITELTSLLSRRSVYCSKEANTDFAVSHFSNPEGNIRFVVTNHTWKGGKCEYCGASESQYKRDKTRETHAYEFIHCKKPEEIFKMKFDVIIGNPPYQFGDGGGTGKSATPIYNLFVDMAKQLNPKYITMIIPSRWMAGGKGLNKFRKAMITDKHITQMQNFISAKDCFNEVNIPGGVCFFLRERDREDKCKIITHNAQGVETSVRYLKEESVDVFIRQPELISINEKVWSRKQKSIASIVSSRKPYGICSDFFTPTVQKEINGVKQKVSVTTEEKYHLPTPSDTPISGGYEIIGLVSNKRVWKYVPKGYPFPKSGGLGKWKIFIPKAYGCGALGEVSSTPVLGTPVLGTPVQACTETFLEIGPWDTKTESINALKYLKTKIFRCLVAIIKQTQNTSTSTYQFVPIQDFTQNSDIDWSRSIAEINDQLCDKYGLTAEERQFIEENITEME